MFYQHLAHFCRSSPKVSLAWSTQTQGAADGTSRCLHEFLLLETFPKAAALPCLWSFPQPKACCGFVLSFLFGFFFLFFLQCIPQPQMHFIGFLPCMFFSCHEVFETWLARLNIFYSCLYTIFSFFKSYPWLWVWTQDFKHLINLL